MKKKLLSLKKSAFLLFASLGICLVIVFSSFIGVEDAQQVCNGPFYTSNVQVPGFAISFPSTGAPGELHSYGSYHWTTCNSCHTGHANNSGTAVLNIDFGAGVTAYVPGQTYTVTLTLSQAPSNFLHFMLTTRDVSTDTVHAAGTFIITDNVKTHIMQPGSVNGFGGGFFGVTKYIEATACGTDAMSTGYNQWTFNWKAPLTGGTVTFYVGATATNNDDATTGDYAYTKAVQFPKAATGIDDRNTEMNIQLYPNPSNGRVEMQISDFRFKNSVVNVFNIAGAKVFQSVITEPKSQIDLSSQPKGIYFLQLQSGDVVVNKKVVIE